MPKFKRRTTDGAFVLPTSGYDDFVVFWRPFIRAGGEKYLSALK